MKIAKWNTFEAWFEGPKDDGSFIDLDFIAEFSCRNYTTWARGFYDGEGRYGLRFMPDAEGEWKYVTRSSIPGLDGLTGTFECTAPESHGPVVVAKTGPNARLGYADGTDYSCVGTTCYCWTHQGDELEEKTLGTLSKGYFNKIRMCIFPKHYLYNTNDPEFYPFVGGKNDIKCEWDPDKYDLESWSNLSKSYDWDFSRFDPAYWRHLEKRILQLQELGIEADLILFHPYDRWGFAQMSHENNLKYLRYAVARLAGYRNVWWSFANEYDLMRNRNMREWDEYFRLVADEDPANHLRSIHNCNGFYDYAKRWVTHCSIQHSDLESVPRWLMTYEKPVVVDECCYEGDIPDQWGNISAVELVNRMWTGFALGGYVGHGETYLCDEKVLWWSRGGILRGEAPERIAFLKKIMESMPKPPVYPEFYREFPWKVDGLNYGEEMYLFYFGVRQPKRKHYRLPEGNEYEAIYFDAWNMTTECIGRYSGETDVTLPGRPYCGLILRKI